MINITKGFFQLNGKQSKIQGSLKIWYPVTPHAPPGQGTPTEKSSSKLATVDTISKASGIHILPNSKKKIA
jgi:hypothetical protein